jgi:hypothetical protein
VQNILFSPALLHTLNLDESVILQNDSIFWLFPNDVLSLQPTSHTDKTQVLNIWNVGLILMRRTSH